LILKKFSVVELFCGCGGFSYGFEWNGNFKTILGIDIKKEALTTFKYNHKGSLAINSDITKIKDSDLINKTITDCEVDVLIGGPPCQGFSQMRRSQSTDGLTGYDKFHNDPRNSLIIRFLEIAKLLNPKVIVIENVKQVKSHVINGKEGGFIKIIKDALEDQGYEIKYSILNSADYGVPQIRERMFVIASRIGIIDFPEATHNREGCGGLDKWVSVENAISDLGEPIFIKKNNDCNDYLSPINRELNNKYLDIVRQELGTGVYNHQTRNYKKDVIDIIKEMEQGKNWGEMANKKREEYEKIISSYPKEKQDETRKKLVEDGFINPVFYKDYYWSAYTRLDPNLPSLTITANAGFLGSGRFTHPYENRGITPREASRLQSFPDSFKFITDENDTSKTSRLSIAFDMIGEAVAPLLAKKIADKIHTHLLKYKQK